ncbi:MAG: hypothetical protein QOG94_1464 [Solirubrobacteraceae bacterium]|nr:hypothetical protein [Solirubrobacteraceae bacterium]
MSSDPPDGPPPAPRASDAEREHAVAILRSGAEHGRLTFDELAKRTELAYGATTGTELQRLVADLPDTASESPVVAAPRKQRRWNVALLGSCDRRGRWRPAPHSIALSVMGGVKLDLRDATIDGDELVITAFAVMGGVDIVVPDGIDVDLSGFALMGGNDHRPGDAPVRPGTPLVRVRAWSLMGGVTVKARRANEAQPRIAAE